MRELSDAEIDEVQGGIAPVIGFGVALASHASGFSGVAGWALSSIGLIGATYGLAEYLHQSEEDAR
jgi:hypothetical protein